MKKYLVIDEPKESGDVYEDIFDTLEEANREAEMKWDYLTRREKNKRHIYVAHVEDNEYFLNADALQGEEVDFLDYHSLDYEAGYFNSEDV